jgi:hypothetical protein
MSLMAHLIADHLGAVRTHIENPVFDIDRVADLGSASAWLQSQRHGETPRR